MEERPTYYAVIPAEIRYDEDLPDKAKILYGEIVALSDKQGYCWATNNYFANLYKVSKVTISRLINLLAKKGYVKVNISYKEGSKEIDNRYIQICLYPINKNDNTPINKNDKGNNTSINNTSINNKKEEKNIFSKPTIEEIQTYCNERNNGIDAEQFYDFYECKGWLVGKNKMKDWKAAVRTWEKRNKPRENIRQSNREFLERKRKEIMEEMNE